MLRLRYSSGGIEHEVVLSGEEIFLGRSADNQVVLPDYAVSRRHAVFRQSGAQWRVVDLGSTNGLLLNGATVRDSVVRSGDRLTVGEFVLRVEEIPGAADSNDATVGREPETRPGVQPEQDPALSHAMIVRSLTDFSAEYGLQDIRASNVLRMHKREALEEAYANQVFGFLTRLAQCLLQAETVDEVLEQVMEIAFEALPVERGFILLRDSDEGDVRCELVRIRERVELRPRDEVPMSRKILETVMNDRVALLTYDAQSDQRLGATDSVLIHRIRAAMCAPLWSGERIMGVLQVDSPHHSGTFTEKDVDLLTALANYCAVAVERIRNARQVEHERQLRSRLERYHSPAHIEAVMREQPSDQGIRRLRKGQVTILFCDVVGFTAWVESEAPERLAEAMTAYFTHAVEAVFRFEGTLDKFIGDGVMAFFGAPVEQPDHALRGVRAALRIQRSLARWNGERTALGLAPIVTRIALNSGSVLVGDVGSERRVDYTVLGNAVNIAARLEESVCPPGQIVLGEATRQLIGEAAPVEAMGAYQLKGLSKPVSVFRLAGGDPG